jgi:hypothetical protein
MCLRVSYEPAELNLAQMKNKEVQWCCMISLITAGADRRGRGIRQASTRAA